MDTRFSAWVDAYALSLLRWAMGKTGSSHQAEDLSQEVWLQFFSAVHREEAQGRAVAQPEHFLWRIAKYVWCKQLRQEMHRPDLAAYTPAEPNFAQAIADEDEQQRLTAWLHRRIVHLSLRTLPKHLRCLAPLDEALALMDIGFMTELIAFKAGYLYKPQSQRDGEFLTMSYWNCWDTSA